MLELLKVIVQPVVLERNADGKVIGEKLGEPKALYDRDQIIEFLDAIDQSIRTENAGIILPDGKEDLDGHGIDNRTADHLR